MELKTNQIRTDGGTQARAQLDNEAVQDYRDILKENGTTWPFPPVVVFHDGSDYWLADGFHRIAAARQHGRFVVEAEVRQGQQRDAILYAAGANADHGLKRTTEDKQRAVTRLLEDAEWGQWSDREIARRCKVSAPFVGGLRVTVNVSSEKEERTYTTKHGTPATMKTSNIGKRAPAEKSDRPTLEERQLTWILIARSMIPLVQEYAKTRDYTPEHGGQNYGEFSLIAFLHEPQGEQRSLEDMKKKLAGMTLAEVMDAIGPYASFARDAQINVTRWLSQRIYQQERAVADPVDVHLDRVETAEAGELAEFLATADVKRRLLDTLRYDEWESARISGLSNPDLRQKISDLFGEGGGSGGPNRAWVYAKGGKSPSFWYDNITGKGEPTLTGGDLLDAARGLLGIPFPEINTPIYTIPKGSPQPAEKDEVLDLLKRAESALCLAVAKYNAAARPSFSQANRAYHALLLVIEAYKKEMIA